MPSNVRHLHRQKKRRLSATSMACACFLAACEGGTTRATRDGGADAAITDSATEDAGALDAGEPDASSPDITRYLHRLNRPEDYAELEGKGTEIKYLAALPDRTQSAPLDAPCTFQNTREYAFHVHFLRSFSAYADLDYESYLSLVMRRKSRLWWGGSLKLFAATKHPLSKGRGIITFTAYQEGGGEENLAHAEIRALFEQLRASMPYASALLVFVPDGGAQVAHVRGLREALLADGVPVLMPEDLSLGLGAQVFSEGESYGYLRRVPQGDLLKTYGPRDVIVVQSAPSDISIVSGLITQHPQSEHSHVNLRLREKGIPNAQLPDVYENGLIASLHGALVHLVVRDGKIEIAPARLADAERFWKAKMPSLQAPAADLAQHALIGFNTLRAKDAKAFGTKAANLGELHQLLPTAHRTPGFGLPFSRYHAFMQRPALAGKLNALLEDAAVKADAVLRAQRLKELRDAITAEPAPEALLHDLVAIAESVFGEAGKTLRLKFRSSTNAEDLDLLSGAGLYESKSGCLADDLDGDAVGPSLCLTADDRAAYEATLAAQRTEFAAYPQRTWLLDSIKDLEKELTQEKSALSAVRKVWASLWSERAFEERAYFGLDHAKVFMALAVNPSFTREQLDAVAVTNVPSKSGALYRIVTQTADIGVVDPLDPSATPETLIFQRNTDNSVANSKLLVPSSRATAGESLWSEEQLSELGAVLFSVQDHFKASVYPKLDPLALDLELKLTHDAKIVVKQVRPYRIVAGP